METKKPKTLWLKLSSRRWKSNLENVNCNMVEDEWSWTVQSTENDQRREVSCGEQKHINTSGDGVAMLPFMVRILKYFGMPFYNHGWNMMDGKLLLSIVGILKFILRWMCMNQSVNFMTLCRLSWSSPLDLSGIIQLQQTSRIDFDVDLGWLDRLWCNELCLT